MGKQLQRDLGLYAVVTISIGAMIGSGIFVLPGLASKIAGPAVILAYLLAGLIVLPAALSKAEMATALPESGGTYLYIDRAMGPMMGTIAGFGAWFSLVFKSAFALVGLGAYLLFFLPGAPISWVAIGLALLLVTVNVLGVKQAGSLQSTIVTGVLVVLGLFILDGMTFVQGSSFHPGFFGKGTEGLLAATGFVFVSYAGVTKIASVAEEVEEPSRNLPLGILLSIGVMMAIYTLIVFVVVGVSDPGPLAESLTPMTEAADAYVGPLLGGWGTAIVAGTAVVALTSMANAGILSSSRFPFAMSRDQLAPDVLAEVSDRFRTPVSAILLTGTAITLLIAFVPVIQLAKLASAFQILVFSIVNLAVVAFREGRAEWYDPPWRSPGYPWVQVTGIVGGIALIAFMGMVPLLGAAGIVAGGFVWYQLYARQRAQREGVGVDAVRQRRDARAVEQTRDALGEGALTVLIPVSAQVSEERETGLMRLATDLVHGIGGQIRVVAFEEVPDQMGLGPARDHKTEEEVAFEQRTSGIADSMETPVDVGEIVSHDAPRALVNYVEEEDIDVVLGALEDLPHAGRRGRGLARRLIQDTSCEVMILDHGTVPERIDRVAVTSDRGPFDAEKVRTANAIAEHNEASLRFVHLVAEDAPETQVGSVQAYHEGLAEHCTVPVESLVVRGRADEDRIQAALDEVDLIVTEAAEYAPRRAGIRESARLISETMAGPVLLVYPRDRERKGRIRRLVDRVLYR